MPLSFKPTKFIGHAPFVEADYDKRGPKPSMKIWESPAKVILGYKDIHKGEAVTIIANGPSVNKVDLGSITTATIGANQAWRLRECTYYCAGDQGQFRAFEKERGDIKKLAPLFALPNGPEHAIRLRALHASTKQFSFDLVEGVYLSNTIMSYALQLAVWMGFETIYTIGLDLVGKHFYGGNEIPERKFANQRETFGFISGLLQGMGHPAKIINLNPDSFCQVFPKEKFERVFPEST